MKRNGITYEEAKGLLLQGHEMKLPSWDGYWKMNAKQDGIEVHTKDGKILDTPDIMYTFYNNWEVATVENCYVLAKEKQSKSKDKKYDFEIVDIEMVNFFGLTPVVAVKFDHRDKPVRMPMEGFVKLVGDRVEAFRMLTSFTLDKAMGDDNLTTDEKKEIAMMTNVMNELVDTISQIDEVSDEPEDCDGDCNRCSGCEDCDEDEEKGIAFEELEDEVVDFMRNDLGLTIDEVKEYLNSGAIRVVKMI